MVRLKDIALRAGVSTMTVSKVLHNASDISAATKARVRQLAQEMGYVPDSMAQGLRSRTTKLLGLVISSTANPIYARTVSAIEEAAFAAGYDILLNHSLNQLEREEACIRRSLSRRVDGIFLSPVYRLAPTAAVYDELLKRKTPTVILGYRAPFCSQFVSVETDDFAASQNLTRHLLDLGHRRIAYFSGPAASPAAIERLEGYKRALRDAGIDHDDRLIFAAGSSIEEGEKAALQFLDEKPGVTAVQTFNDLVAIGAATIFLKQGLKIPQDLSLAGFGNILTAQYFQIPLTTVREPKFRMGVAAFELMDALLRGQRPPSTRLPAEVIVRASTAAPP